MATTTALEVNVSTYVLDIQLQISMSAQEDLQIPVAGKPANHGACYNLTLLDAPDDAASCPMTGAASES